MMSAEADSLPLRLLAGSGRSGTTWLLDVLCEANHLHPVFEPLHPHGWDRARRFSRRYATADTLDAGQADADLKGMHSFWNALLKGDYPSTWIDYRVRPDRLWPVLNDFSSINALKRRVAHWVRLYRQKSRYARPANVECLVKVIRANLLLPALVSRPNTHWALIMRHPAAVVESQLRLGGDWDAQRIASCYARNDTLSQRLGEDWRDWEDQLRSDAEVLTFIWCLENVLPLEDIGGAEQHVTFYEKLAENDGSEWAKLLDNLSLRSMPDLAVLERPSQQSSEVMGKNVDRPKSALDRLQPADRDGIQRVLDITGVDFYHTGSLLPEPEKLTSRRPWSRTT